MLTRHFLNLNNRNYSGRILFVTGLSVKVSFVMKENLVNKGNLLFPIIPACHHVVTGKDLCKMQSSEGSEGHHLKDRSCLTAVGAINWGLTP